MYEHQCDPAAPWGTAEKMKASVVDEAALPGQQDTLKKSELGDLCLKDGSPHTPGIGCLPLQPLRIPSAGRVPRIPRS
jgi:hypothetical protein